MTSLVWFNVKISRESNRVHGWWYDGNFRENNLVKMIDRENLQIFTKLNVVPIDKLYEFQHFLSSNE